MGIFQNNILKPEELIGSFEPFTDGDETFALNTMGDYPGDLPDFDFFESLVPPKPEVIDIPEPIIEEEPQESDGVWEMFEDNTQPTTNETVSTNDIDDLFSNANQDFAPVADMETEIVSNGVPNTGIIDEDDKLEQMLREAMESEENESTSANSLDDELSAVNIGELFNEQPAPTPVIPKIEPGPIVANPPITEVPINANKEFEDIEKIAEAVEININNVYPTHPSKTGIDDPQQIPNQEEIPNPKSKKKKEKIKKPINNKLLKRISYIALALIFIAGASAGVYYSGLINTATTWFASKPNTDSTALKQENKVKPVHPAVVEQQANQNAEKVHTNQNGIPEVKEDISKHSEQVSGLDEHKTVAESEKQVAKELPKVIEKIETPRKEIKTVAKTKQTPSERKSKSKPENNTLATTKATNSTLTKPETEVYVIQIYASPSKEDAQEWLRKVQKRIGSEAYISTQVVRDKVWYRVRCGHYTNKESATAAAEKYGFSQSWIDRIK